MTIRLSIIALAAAMLGALTMGAQVRCRADVRVLQLGDRLRLALEPLAVAPVLAEAIRQNLDRHLAVETRVAGTVDLAHAALTGQRHDLVTPEAGSRFQDHDFDGSLAQLDGHPGRPDPHPIGAFACLTPRRRGTVT